MVLQLLWGNLLLAGLLRRDHALDDLGLLNQERANDPVAHARRAARSSVRALDSLLALRDLGVLAGAEGRDSRKGDVAVTALGRGGGLLDDQVAELASCETRNEMRTVSNRFSDEDELF